MIGQDRFHPDACAQRLRAFRNTTLRRADELSFLEDGLWSYLSVQALADEPLFLARAGLEPTACTLVDAQVCIGTDAIRLRLCHAPRADGGAPGVYARWNDDEDPATLAFMVVSGTQPITRAVLEDAIRHCAHIHARRQPVLATLGAAWTRVEDRTR